MAITGHQARPGIDWAWVADAVRAQLADLAPVETVITCLAAGADQVAAQVALELEIPLTTIVPLSEYERFFEGEGLKRYRTLLEQSSRCVTLNASEDEQQAFMRASKAAIEAADVLLAIWDGAPAQGLGGTADVVAYARRCERRVTHVNPLTRTVAELGSTGTTAAGGD